ncbi:hypothetical protein DFH09DRAFT_1093932 [Mycena vulgaris]|nr:hypothetical protein DFH09DRAFT_1093932 [Mycena vulgaris]
MRAGPGWQRPRPAKAQQVHRVSTLPDTTLLTSRVRRSGQQRQQQGSVQNRSGEGMGGRSNGELTSKQYSAPSVRDGRSSQGTGETDDLPASCSPNLRANDRLGELGSSHAQMKIMAYERPRELRESGQFLRALSKRNESVEHPQFANQTDWHPKDSYDRSQGVWVLVLQNTSGSQTFLRNVQVLPIKGVEINFASKKAPQCPNYRVSTTGFNCNYGAYVHHSGFGAVKGGLSGNDTLVIYGKNIDGGSLLPAARICRGTESEESPDSEKVARDENLCIDTCTAYTGVKAGSARAGVRAGRAAWRARDRRDGAVPNGSGSYDGLLNIKTAPASGRTPGTGTGREGGGKRV